MNQQKQIQVSFVSMYGGDATKAPALKTKTSEFRNKTKPVNILPEGSLESKPSHES